MKGNWLRCWILIFTLFSCVGCGKSEKTGLIIMLDNSSSAFDQMMSDYGRIIETYSRHAKAEQPFTFGYTFCNTPKLVFQKEALGSNRDLWPLIDVEVKQRGPSPEKGTYYAPVFSKVATICRDNPEVKFTVLVLSDGRPDDKDATTIPAAVKEAAGCSNLRLIFMAPVRNVLKDVVRDGKVVQKQDLRVRDKVLEMLESFGRRAYVAGDSDYGDRLKEMMAKE